MPRLTRPTTVQHTEYGLVLKVLRTAVMLISIKIGHHYGKTKQPATDLNKAEKYIDEARMFLDPQTPDVRTYYGRMTGVEKAYIKRWFCDFIDENF